jgi:hypothetical protein
VTGSIFSGRLLGAANGEFPSHVPDVYPASSRPLGFAVVRNALFSCPVKNWSGRDNSLNKPFLLPSIAMPIPLILAWLGIQQG